jgi:integrase
MSGLGSLYKQRNSQYWWYKISTPHGVIRKSTGTADKRKAREVLRTIIERIGSGSFLPTEAEVMFEEIAAGYLYDYEVSGNRSTRDAQRNVKALSAHFGGLRALDIRQTQIQAYIRQRLADGLKNASINRELAALRRMFSLAKKQEVLSRVPVIELLQENNVRQNFLQPADFEAIQRHLPDYLRDGLRWLYLCGGRKNEMVSLQWRDVGDSEVVIRAENTKTKRSRTIPLVGELSAIIERQRSARRLDCQYVFHRHGKSLGDFRKAWHAARVEAGYPNTWIHDFRRSAARNLVRTPGVSMHTAMQITGHQTASMFRRYDIQDMADVTDALTRTQERIQSAPSEPKVKVIR